MHYIGMDCHITTLDFAVVNEAGRLVKADSVTTSVNGFMGFVKTVPPPRTIYIEEGTLAAWALETCVRFREKLVITDAKKNYWGLSNLARQYSGASGIEKNALIDSGRSILKTKSSTFSFAQILFSIGTIAYSILFVTYGVIPAIIGWFGIVAGVLYGLGNGITPVIPKFKALLYSGALFCGGHFEWLRRPKTPPKEWAPRVGLGIIAI